MALFRPYQRPDQKPVAENPASTLVTTRPTTSASSASESAGPSSSPAASPSEELRQPTKKGRPTPTRKQAERERMERLHPTLSPKEARRAERRARAEARNADFLAADNTPERKLLRNYVDSRFHITEILLPLMLIVMAITIFGSRYWLPIITWSTLATWVVVILGVLDIVITWRGYKKLLAQRVPGARTRGLGVYMMNRMIQLRRFRIPKPAIERGAKV